MYKHAVTMVADSLGLINDERGIRLDMKMTGERERD